jgi:hypothetical protein
MKKRKSFAFGRVSGDATGGVVVGCHRRCGLGVSHFSKGNAERTRFFAVVKQRAKFGFGSAQEDFVHDVT